MNFGLVKIANETITDSIAINGGIINAYSVEQYVSVLIFGTIFNRNSEITLDFESATFHMIESNFTTLDDYADKTLSLTVVNQTEGASEDSSIPAGTPIV